MAAQTLLAERRSAPYQSMMLFSVITVVRDNLAGLRVTHDSIAAQSCADFEWLVIDGGSEDGTQDFLGGLSFPALRWLSGIDAGLYDAMNRGLALARGDYVLFLNGGDRLAAAETLAQIRDGIAAQPLPPDFIYGDALEERPGHAPVLKKARSIRYFYHGMITHHQAMLYHRAGVGPLRFDITCRIAADFKFTARIVQEAQRTLYLPLPLCLFEAGGVSQRRARLGRNEQFRIRSELALTGDFANLAIYGQQTLIMLLRRFLPDLYWRLRGEAPPPADAADSRISA